MRKIKIDKSRTPKYTLIKVSGPVACGKTTLVNEMAKDYQALGYTFHRTYEGDEPIKDSVITTPPSRTVVFLETINP